MSGLQLDYETVSRVAQQAGTVFFVCAFLAAVIYALLPHNSEAFRRLAQLPLEDDESDHD
ncbi:MAG: cbb3-type cytochrome c oxidase subunit 3 [Phenylobacterium sp.]